MTLSETNPPDRESQAGQEPSEQPLPLAGLKVLDIATLFAGPMIATLMADFGADVVKVEHPQGDSLRTFGWQKNGVSLWWALISRNKRCVTDRKSVV